MPFSVLFCRFEKYRKKRVDCFSAVCKSGCVHKKEHPDTMKTETTATTVTWHILHRTGRVYSTFPGTLDEAQKECDARNSSDEAGATEVYASFPSKEECREYFYLLID